MMLLKLTTKGVSHCIPHNQLCLTTVPAAICVTWLKEAACNVWAGPTGSLHYSPTLFDTAC